MQMIFEKKKLNINSNERKDLILKGKTIGTYNYGTYSKLAIMRAKAHKPIINYEDFICGLIHRYFEIEIDNANDIENAMRLCKEREDIELIDWITDTLNEMSASYED
ncbi:MAG: hypothetical protein ACLT4F_08775 [Clostridia bacterium]|jgi:hypothetical protein